MELNWRAVTHQHVVVDCRAFHARGRWVPYLQRELPVVEDFAAALCSGDAGHSVQLAWVGGADGADADAVRAVFGQLRRIGPHRVDAVLAGAVFLRRPSYSCSGDLRRPSLLTQTLRPQGCEEVAEAAAAHRRGGQGGEPEYSERLAALRARQHAQLRLHCPSPRPHPSARSDPASAEKFSHVSLQAKSFACWAFAVARPQPN